MTASIRITGDHIAQAPRCDECDRTIWCTEVHDGEYVFCSTDCRNQAPDNVACTETGARLAFDPLPAPATARLGTQEPSVASVPSSTPARPAPADEQQPDSGGDLSRRVSPSPMPGGIPAMRWRKVHLGPVNLWFRGESGPLAPAHHVRDGELTIEALVGCMEGTETSYAHVYPDGVVSRFGKQIAVRGDIHEGWPEGALP